MTGRYEVVARGKDGRPQRIRCVAHEGCDWGMTSEGARRDDDPVFEAQFRRHLLDAETTEKRDLGRLRRGR